MKFSVAMTRSLNDALSAHLVRADRQEDLCFALWYPSRGFTRTTALMASVILPKEGDRTVHGNAEFNPQYVMRAIRCAREAGAGLAFLHSHPTAGWQAMSRDDIRAEEGMAGAVLGATGLPLVGLTLAAADGAWSARFWPRTKPRMFERAWCETVRVDLPPIRWTV